MWFFTTEMKREILRCKLTFAPVWNLGTGSVCARRLQDVHRTLWGNRRESFQPELGLTEGCLEEWQKLKMEKIIGQIRKASETGDCTTLSSGPSRALLKYSRQLLNICCMSEERATHVLSFGSIVLAFSRAIWKHDTLSLCKYFRQEQTIGRKSLRTDDVSNEKLLGGCFLYFQHLHYVIVWKYWEKKKHKEVKANDNLLGSFTSGIPALIWAL